MTSSDSIDWRSLIERQLTELQQDSDASSESRQPVELDQTRQGRLSRMDALQGQAMANATETRRRQKIAALEGALRRLDNGRFGECRECGENIATPRLLADPSTALCIDCASARE